ncbi:hypothetical protein TNIN_21011 [Trichonephila inaurata madagascariensis]|uniref:Uncharacterized protein n=1 Tax=Trichonephila inaurata madagascariensis TaxID=2747483 RepID=A0A8X6Y4B3_9ARAC|nr:hypothetical protein TNIN_21011 [Trichonephila inaurata madagascariensis]
MFGKSGNCIRSQIQPTHQRSLAIDTNDKFPWRSVTSPRPSVTHWPRRRGERAGQPHRCDCRQRNVVASFRTLGAIDLLLSRQSIRFFISPLIYSSSFMSTSASIVPLAGRNTCSFALIGGQLRSKRPVIGQLNVCYTHF